jgi:preprotein translocase subunit YajC
MDPLTLAMFGVLAVLVFFTWRSSRKRKQAAEQQKEQLQPGVEIMTNFGLYGTLVSIDTVTNIAEVEVSPGNVLKLHPGAISKVITDVNGDPDAPRSVEEAMARANAEAEAREAEEESGKAQLNTDTAIVLGEPEFGERVDEPKKPVRRSSSSTSAKKSAE